MRVMVGVRRGPEECSTRYVACGGRRGGESRLV